MSREQQKSQPSGWIFEKLGDVLDVKGGSQPPKTKFIYEPQDGYVQLLQIRDFGAKPVPTFVPARSVTKFCDVDDVLIARYGASLGRILTGKAGAYNVALAKTIFDPRLLFGRFVFYLLKTSILQTPLKMISRSAQNGFAKHEIAHAILPIPPLNEQRRIVAKIEELFSELDKGVESLKTARAQLKIYRQAVLKHAFEGKLTADWREQNKDKLEPAEKLLERIKAEREARYLQQLEEWEDAVKKWEAGGKVGKKPGKPRPLKHFKKMEKREVVELQKPPSGWGWDKLGWMTCGVDYGTAAKSAKSGEVPVLRMGNMQGGKLDWSDLAYTSDKAEIQKYILRVGDVLFNRTNSPELVGKTVIYRGEQPALFAGYLIRVNHIEAIVDGQYLNMFLNSHVAKQESNRVKTDGVNQSNINGEKLQNYPFPYCSILEQQEIVRILDEKVSLIDQMESDIAIQLRRSNSLRQAILKKAFSGELVAQDLNDEPAAVLLERIKAENTEKAAAQKRTKTKTHSKTKRKTAA